MAQQKSTLNSDYLISVVARATAFVPLVMIPFGFLVKFGFVDGRFYAGDAAFGSISVAYIAVASAWLLYEHKNKRDTFADAAFLILFHALLLAFILYVSGFLSVFAAIWIVLMASSDVHFPRFGYLWSMLALSVTALLSVLLHPLMLPSEQLEVVQDVVVVGAIGFALSRIRILTERERYTLAKIREQEMYQRERLLTLVNSMGDAVVATDEQGEIKVYNSTLLSLLDTNLNLNGKQIDNVLQLTDNANHRIDLVQEARERRTVFSRSDLSYTFADAETIRLYVNVAPIQPSYRSKAERGYIFILRDITKEKSLEEERDEFISVVSHELRTPVAIAEGGLSNVILLQDRGASADVLKKAATSAHDQILYLSKLINDLSALSRAERGLGAETEVVDVSDIIHHLYGDYLKQAQAKGLALNIDIATSHLPKVISSRLYIEEILQNLMTNALKYTREGSITISAGKTKQGLVVTIKDSGIGISKADQKHIFEKFYRSEDYRTRESNGTGLGLYVCQKLAEKIGLDLTFDSRLNHGSAFTLTIPAKQFATAGQTKVAATPAAVAGPKPGSTRSAPSN